MTDKTVNQTASGVLAAPLKLAVIGCGTITEQFHMPVLAGHEGIEVAALVDRDEARARKMADAYRVPVVLTDLKDLPAHGVQAALLATPPFHHAPGTLALIKAGIHVLVEKPMALTHAEGLAMCEAAEAANVVLSVGVYKRLLPVTQLLHTLVASERYGRPVRVGMDWGGIGGYASATLGLLRREFAGGGVLIDLGSHVFDQLLAILGGTIVIDDYRDDARGGIEADSDVHLHFDRPQGRVDGLVRLSRVRNLSGLIRIECEHATLEAPVSERFDVTVRPRDAGTAPFVVRPIVPPDVSWYEAYRAEVDDFLNAIGTRKPPALSGRSVLPTLQAVDDCYAHRSTLTLPWFDGMPRRVSTAPSSDRPRKVLVTGGGGFIGGRVADILALRDRWQVRAFLRGAASGGRLARLPIELVLGDLVSDADVAKAVEGCDAVVHCAVGTAYGYPRQIRAVTVGGTERLVKAAHRAGVSRFVHVSTIGVHDPAHEGVIDERTPVSPPRDDWYGRTKADAEAAVRHEEQRGLSVAIIRPGCVYGPYGFTFVINPLRAIARGAMVLENAADVAADTVFVDNLVEAIVCALEAPADAVRQQAFPISDGDNCTWAEYYGYFADQMGRTIARRDAPPATEAAGNPVQQFMSGISTPFISAEAKGFAKRVLQSDPLGTVPRYMLEKYPALEQKAREIAGMNEPVIYRRELAGPPEPFRVTGRRSHITIEHARRQLGFDPPISRDAAQALTWQWATYAGIV